MKPLKLKIYNNLDLVPEPWIRARGHAPAGAGNDWYVFNPTLVRLTDAYVMTYRVVDEVHKTRRIASCKLATDLSIVPGSVTPLSDLIEFEGSDGFTQRTLTWHADPRYFRLGTDLYVFWNDGSVKPGNHQFLLKIGPDGLTPAGKARLVRKTPHEARIEKNWQFFDSPQGVHVIYENRPLHLLTADLSGSGAVVCREVVKTDWVTAYEDKFGHIRGGAQPVLHHGSLLTLAHSSHKNSHGKLVYHPWFYQFEAQHPFSVTHRPKGPFMFAVPGLDKPRLPQLNKQTAAVVYPGGLVIEQDRTVMSFGVNDEACAVGVFQTEDILDSMEPVDASPKANAKTVPASAKAASHPSAVRPDDARVPLFWWNAIGKRFDPEVGGRFFATGNVGDIASKLFVEMLSGVECRPPRKNERKLLSIGSILQNAAEGDVVWGSGIKGTAEGFKHPVRELEVHAVRGPLTVDFLRRQGIAVPQIKELFDPGCLIPHLYAEELRAVSPRQRNLCVIPHYKDHLFLEQQHPELADSFLSVDAMPLDFVKDMLGVELVVSSSLHGIIFAEALGIPALWLAPVNGEDELKYYDYYYGTGRYHVKRFSTIGAALRAEPMALPKFRFEDYLRTFPQDAIRGLCTSPPPEPVSQWTFAPECVANAVPSKPLPSKVGALGSDSEAALMQGDFQRPPSLYLTEAITALRDRRLVDGVPALYSASVGTRDSKDTSLEQLVQRAARLYIGCQDFGAVTGRLGSELRSLPAQQLLVRVLSEALHQSPAQAIPNNLVDVISQHASAKTGADALPWQLLLALARGRQGLAEEEGQLLKTARNMSPGEFWCQVQQVYRFSVDLHSLNQRAGGILPQPDQLADSRGPLKVFCYPSFNQINSYQTLLYGGLEASGQTVSYCHKISELETLKPLPEKTNVLHLHWVSAFFKQVNAEEFTRRAAYVLTLLTRLKSEGFSLAWTIHNSISHDSVNPEKEASFNRKLYALCDWVFVHHPMAAQALDWLPHAKKLRLVEHGSYGCPDHMDRLTARRELGMDFDGPLISVIGHLRDYKELDRCLPHVLKVLNKHPGARLLVAGQIHSPALRQLLNEKKCEQVMVMDRVLKAEELHLCMDATDVGLLSYRDILTSGSLVHWLSRGVPVIAPAKGTIPGYVVEGWNGFLYGEYEDLARVLQSCLSLPASQLALLKGNALAGGSSMQWRFH
jgi:predicted GH43/DUF377 family glycosyl hydrolase/glycosyltransferase involved in cell wall biosynthesis